MRFDDLIVEHRDGVATITINRPDSRNALRARTFEELVSALVGADVDPSVGVIVITGAGDKAFCAGGDLNMAAELTTTEAVREHYIHRMIRLGDTVLMSAKPVVCAVNGACVGGGAELSMFCDYVLATEDASFTFSGTDIGGSAWWGAAQLLPLMVGLRRAEDILLTARTVGAREALTIGLATRVESREAFPRAVTETTDTFLARSEEGLRLTKAALRATKQTMLASMALAAESAIAAHETSDVLAAFEAFRAGNPMDWRARRKDQ